ncbi:hypothetical protein [Radicibacter daui]|uniref:hypothetical protein n=1 Tax=Radicibacter daui TaxID=3064829 RepID=UPI004046CA0D
MKHQNAVRSAAGIAGAALCALLAGCQPTHVVTAAEAPQDYLSRVNSGPDDDCDPAIAKQVAALGVPLADFNSIRVYRDGPELLFANGFDGPPQAYIAWVDLKSCKGDLALRFDRYCRFTSSYASGDCQVPESKPANGS